MWIPRRRLLPPRGIAALLFVSFLFACQDTPTNTPDVPGPQFDISEARFGDGNPDFFFAAPLAETPQSGDKNFDDGAANETLVPAVRVCVTADADGDDQDPEVPDGNIEDHTGCVEDVTATVTGSDTGLPMTFNADTELFQVNWKTDLLDPVKEYRIEVWALEFPTEDRQDFEAITFPSDHSLLADQPRWLFGWRDIDDSPNSASCDGTEEFCLINYGQTLPVKVRIEDFVFCPVSRNCAVQFVPSGEDAVLQALVGAEEDRVQVQIPGQDGTDFTLALEPCTAEERDKVSAFIALPTFGDCVRTVTPPGGVGQLQQAADIVYCEGEDIDENKLADPETQRDDIKLYHFSTGGDPNGEITHAEALPEKLVGACPSLASAESDGGLLALTRSVGYWARSLFRPQPLRAIHGGSWSGDNFDSIFWFVLPGKFEYLVGGDGTGTAPVGSDMELTARVTDLDGVGILNARVGWGVVDDPGGDAVVTPEEDFTDPSGESTTTLTLSATPGDNVVHATGHGIADDREAGCTDPTTGEDVPCNGPRDIFDPFQPLDGGDIDVVPDSTRLRFTITGCVLGRGTPEAIDGDVAGDSGWDCANQTTFPVNLSGGSTVEATLYWMNDDTDFHLGVSVPGADRNNSLRIEWDSDGDGVPGGSNAGDREAGDDVWTVDVEDNVGTGGDKFIDEKCSDSSQTSCEENDGDFSNKANANQTVAVFDNTQGGVTVYEMSHPLDAGDTCDDPDPKKGCGMLFNQSIDLAASQGDMPGFFLTLQLGNGAQGNTQWPGFLEYMKVTIQ